MDFSRTEYLVVVGALIFGLAITNYLVSWGQLIREGRLFKEWKFVLWSLGLFLATLAHWWFEWEVVGHVDESYLSYLIGFVETGLYFLISIVINRPI